MPDGEAGAPPLSTGAILHKTARGAGWVIGWRMARRLLGFINLLVLARLLVPADFGVVALAAGLAGSLDALATVGVEDALVREKALNRALYDTGFTMNVLRGLLTGGALAALAVPAAWFFRDPRLTDVILVLAALTIAAAFTNIGTVDFRRDMAFQKEFALLAIPRIVGFLVTLLIALQWHSYWALVAGIATNRLLQLGQSYIMHPYRPQISLRSWRKIIRFSLWSWAMSVVISLKDRTDNFLIGHVLGDAAVGTYALALEIGDLPSSELVGPLTRACYSSFAASRASGQGNREVYLRILGAVALFSVPASIGLSAVADVAVRLLLGAKWLQAIPLVQAFGLFGSVAVFGLLSYNLLSVYGVFAAQFRVLVLSATVRLTLLLIFVWRLGLMGAVLAAGIGVVVEFIGYFSIAVVRFQIGWGDLARALWRTVLGTAAMSAALAATGLGWASASGDSVPALLRALMEAVAVGAFVYGAVVTGGWLAAGRPEGAEADVLTLLRKRLRSAKPA